MKTKKMRGLLLGATVIGLAAGTIWTVQAAVPEDIWDYTESYDENDNIVYDFAEVEVTLPADWDGKYGMTEGDDYIGFYHLASRDAITKKYGNELGGGLLFCLSYYQDYSFQQLPDYQVVGSGDEGMYILYFPTDVQGYTDDADIWDEWSEMISGVQWVTDRVILTNPGEGIADPDNISDTGSSSSTTTTSGDYLISDSSSRVLSASDLKGMNADELQMAINEIYARHGRKFATRSIQDYFNSKSWYKGTVDPAKFNPASLSQTEGKNVALMIQCMSTAPAGSSSGTTSGTTASGNTGSTAANGTKMYATVTVNIRSKASTGGAVLGVVPQGYSVVATGSASNGWVPVNYNGIKGYVFQDYLKNGSGSSTGMNSTGSLPSVPVTGSEGNDTSIFQNQGSITGVIISKDDNTVELEADDGSVYDLVIGQHTAYERGEVGDYVSISYFGDLEEEPQIQSMYKQSTAEELSDGIHSVEGTITYYENDIVYVQTDDGEEYEFVPGMYMPSGCGVGDYVSIQYRGVIDAPEIVGMMKY